MPQRRVASAPPSTKVRRPRTAGKNGRRPSSGQHVNGRKKQSKQFSGDADSEHRAASNPNQLGPRVSKAGHCVADSWSRQSSGSRRRSWMLEDHPGADLEDMIDQWRSADFLTSKRKLPTQMELQKMPSSEQARRVLAGELSPRTALPFLHSVKERLADEKTKQRMEREQRIDKHRHTLQVGVRAVSLVGELERQRSAAAARTDQLRLQTEADERRRRREIKLAERKRQERQRLRMRGIYSYDEAGVIIL